MKNWSGEVAMTAESNSVFDVEQEVQLCYMKQDTQIVHSIVATWASTECLAIWLEEEYEDCWYLLSWKIRMTRGFIYLDTSLLTNIF